MPTRFSPEGVKRDDAGCCAFACPSPSRTTTSAVPPESAPPPGPLVPGDLADRGEGGDPRDAASAVGCRPGLVQTRDRRAEVGVAGRGPHVEELVRRQLAVEDVAADQTVRL